MSRNEPARCPAPSVPGPTRPRAGELSRREFLRLCSFVTAVLALPPRYVERVAGALSDPEHAPSVIWLSLQSCGGDTESFLRSAHPSAVGFVMRLLTLDFHDVLMAPSGGSAAASLRRTADRGGHLLVVEGSIPTAEHGAACVLGGRPGTDLLREAASGARALIAVGSCAAYGGIAAAAPNPTGAVGAPSLVPDRPWIALPGCPVNAVNLAATLVHVLTFGEPPAADRLGRPLFAYGAYVHERCPRRGHFDEGRFVREWGDEGHYRGWCLYRMGCKGPRSHANCPVAGWNGTSSWAVAAGHPCIGCTEPLFWDAATPFYRVMGQARAPSIDDRGDEHLPVGIALGAAGAAAGAAMGVGALVRQRRRRRAEDDAAGRSGTAA